MCKFYFANSISRFPPRLLMVFFLNVEQVHCKSKENWIKSQFNYQHPLMLIKNRARSVTLNISANCNEQTTEMLIQLVRLSWYATINLNSRLRLFGVWLRSTLSGEIFKVVYCVTHLTWITTWKWSGFSGWFTFNCRSILSKLIGT